LHQFLAIGQHFSGPACSCGSLGGNENKTKSWLFDLNINSKVDPLQDNFNTINYGVKNMKLFFKRCMVYLAVWSLLVPVWSVGGLSDPGHAYAATPTISSVAFAPTSGVQGIGDTITMTINADATGYTGGAISVNGIDVTSTLVDNGDNTYTVAYIIESGNNDVADTATIPVSVVMSDGVNPVNTAFVTAPSASSTPAVDAHAPLLVSAQTKTTTTMEVAFSEDLNGSTVNSSGNEFLVSGHTVSAASEIAPGVVQLAVDSLMGGEAPLVTFFGDIKDLAGNDITAAGPIVSSDGIKPLVTSAVASPNPSSAESITIVASFSETMNTSVDPEVVISGIVGSPISVSKIAFDNTTWVGTFDLPDNNENANAAVSITGASDIAGNVMVANESALTIAVDTAEPFVTVNTLNTNDVTPDLGGTINDPASTLSVSVGGSDYPAAISGVTWGSTVTSALADGIYNIVATATDALGNIGTDTTVNELIIDTVKPVISVSPVSLSAEFGSTYNDSGVSALDVVGGNITASVVKTGSVNTFMVGQQTISYNVSDAAGNVADPVTRTVTVTPKSTQIVAGATTNVTSTTPEVIVPSNIEGNVTVNVPSSVNNGTLNLSAFLQISGENKVVTIPSGSSLTINTETASGTIQVTIPAGTVITGPGNWNGIINLAQVKPTDGISPVVDTNLQAANINVYEIGAGDSSLTFSVPVKIVFGGQAGKSLGFQRGSVFTLISAFCDSLTAPTITGNGECKGNSGNDLVVWTKHFTRFVTYNQTLVALPAPDVTATTLTRDSNKYIRVEWKGVDRGVEKYIIVVNGANAGTIAASGDDSGVSYASEIKVLENGKYDVRVEAWRGSEVSKSAVKTVEFVEIVSQSTAATTVTAESVVAAPAAPSRSKAQQPSVEQKPEETQPQEKAGDEKTGDDAGIIKGDDEGNEGKINWTPWIILFILILLTGAATGAYFYWFGDEEEVVAPAATVKEPKAEPKESVKTAVKKKPTNKRSKRW
jgi:hypothetical protein